MAELGTTSIATMTVQVQPELPDDFATTVDKAVRIATAEAHLRLARMLLFDGLDPDVDDVVQKHFDGIYDALHPEAAGS